MHFGMTAQFWGTGLSKAYTKPEMTLLKLPYDTMMSSRDKTTSLN